MVSSKAEVVALVRDLFATARPKLARTHPLQLPAFEEEVRRLEREAVAEARFSICFLGNAGVGKTTLINAIVDPRCRVLPQGGVGPLTARETRVTFAPEPTLEVEYCNPADLDGWKELLSSSDGNSQARGHVKGLLQLATSGNQFELRTVEVLVDALSVIQGSGPSPDHRRSADAERVGLARRRVAAGAHRVVASNDRNGFLAEVGLHTSGPLSPFARRVTVGWPSEALRGGLVLVDLPGLGVVIDAYQATTDRYLKDESAICVVVVDRAGLVDVIAKPMQETGLFRRLLHGAPASGRGLGVLSAAVVKLDLTADDARRADKARAWLDHLSDANAQAVVLLKSQVRQELERAAVGLHQHSSKHETVDRALAAVTVVPVLPTEAQRRAANDPEAPSKVENDALTGVPELIQRARLALERSGQLAQDQFLSRVLDLQNRVVALMATKAQPPPSTHRP